MEFSAWLEHFHESAKLLQIGHIHNSVSVIAVQVDAASYWISVKGNAIKEDNGTVHLNSQLESG